MKRILFAIGVIAYITASAQSGTDSTRTQNYNPEDIDISLIDSMQYAQIARVVIVGNERTRQSIIKRELSLKEGDVVYVDDLAGILEKDRRRVFNLHLFNTVKFRAIPVAQNIVDLIIEVDERWFTFPIPRFQLSDRNFNEWWENYNHDLKRVTYGLKLYQYNMRGRNETLFFTMLFGFQRKFDLTYRIPYIDKKQKQGLIVQMDYIDAKNLAFRTNDHKLEFLKYTSNLRNTRGISVTYTFRNSFYEHHRLTYGYRDTEIADTIRSLNENYLGKDRLRQRYDAISYEFISDRRDVFAYPLKGHQFTFHAQRNGVFQNKDVSKNEAWVSFAKFFDLGKNFYLSNFTLGYTSSPEQLPYFNYGALGYNNALIRGYEVYVIESPNYFLNKTTFKKRIFQSQFRWESWPIEQFRHVQLAMYLKAYADFGYAKNYPNYTLNTRLADKFLGSTGLGLDFVTSYDLVLRFEYTFTVENTNGFFFHIKKEF